MKRLLVNIICAAILAGIFFVAWQNYEGSPAPGSIESIDWGDFPQTIPEQWRKGQTPNEQLAYLRDLMHIRYPENISITGFWDIRPLNNTDYIKYEISVDYTAVKNPDELAALRELENRVMGELAIATARMRFVETQIPGIGTNALNEMAIYVEKIHVARRSIDEGANAVFEDVPTGQEYKIKRLHVFERKGIIGLAKETNPLNWEVYQTPFKYDFSVPNQGISE